ncbi:MAG: large subunit ribosomal protein [Patescibacteria group bacterium]|nr:large subunit ribosomal protein [Patescibacteria group bacterium]MDQ5958382.1 large subunit ribosomal protein [Patescibacteria group bacterium]
MAVSTYTATGTKATTAAKLNKDIFETEVTNHELLKQSYVTYMANGRLNLAKTLKRGEVSGGGKKPWRQKGTGNARTGSIRNPIWRGGGITFGPSGNENYSKKLNVQAKRQALRQALTVATQEKNFIVVDDFKTNGKVKDTVNLLSKIGASRKTILVVNELNDLVLRATNNLTDVYPVYVRNLSVVDILDANTIVVSKKSLETIDEWLGAKK